MKFRIIGNVVTVGDWWTELSSEQQTEYKQEHPASRKAKEDKEDVVRPMRKPTPAQRAKRRVKNAAAKQRWNALMETKTTEDRVGFEQARQRKLVIPPAWTHVWINPDKSADLQAKGRDTKNRITYLYSVKHNMRAKASKFKRLKMFANALPRLQARIERDVRRASEEAKALYLIAKTGFRVGDPRTESRGGDVQTFGASTLQAEHVDVDGDTVHFKFVGKKGVQQSHSVTDPLIADMVKHIQEGQKLFNTDAIQIRKYLKSISGKKDFMVKDFRTHTATSMALKMVADMVPPINAKQYKAAVMRVATAVSERLGNTPAMAKNSYIDPATFQAWEHATT